MALFVFQLHRTIEYPLSFGSWNVHGSRTVSGVFRWQYPCWGSTHLREIPQIASTKWENYRGNCYCLYLGEWVTVYILVSYCLYLSELLGHPVLRRDPLWACRLCFFFFPSFSVSFRRQIWHPRRPNTMKETLYWPGILGKASYR